MACSTSINPVRVGFNPTSWITICEPGVISAATIRNAAAEISPGSLSFCGGIARRVGGSSCVR